MTVSPVAVQTHAEEGAVIPALSSAEPNRVLVTRSDVYSALSTGWWRAREAVTSPPGRAPERC
jgi:hypothetical protein